MSWNADEPVVRAIGESIQQELERISVPRTFASAFGFALGLGWIAIDSVNVYDKKCLGHFG